MTARWVVVLGPLGKDMKPKTLRWPGNAEFLSDTMSQSSVLQIDGIPTRIIDILSKLRPGSRMTWTAEMGLEKADVLLGDAFTFNRLKCLEVGVGGPELVFARRRTFYSAEFFHSLSNFRS